METKHVKSTRRSWFPLPSAMDNRPLKFEEFEQKLNSSFMFQQHLVHMKLNILIKW